jgi:EAL domain-containing protein (putative c-di-GMP-specific phosphodiesterase class I)
MVVIAVSHVSRNVVNVFQMSVTGLIVLSLVQTLPNDLINPEVFYPVLDVADAFSILPIFQCLLFLHMTQHFLARYNRNKSKAKLKITTK